MFFKKQKLRTKIIFVGILASLSELLAFVLAISIISSLSETKIKNELGQLAKKRISEKTTTIYRISKAASDAIDRILVNNLNFGWNLITKAGGFNLSSEMVTWVATNQFTKEKVEVKLPKLYIGSKWLGQNYTFDNPTPVVDEIANLGNCTATIFQRMNEQGDMLRVATTVKTKDGKRAIGTYIPFYEEEGKVNAVVSTVLKGNTYAGNAFVVDRWYQTVYEPIKDASGKIIGMCYAGIPLEKFQSHFILIEKGKFGATGNVIIIAGKGDFIGSVIKSSDSTIIGKNLFEKKDINNEYYFRNMLENAMRNKSGEIQFEKYIVWDSVNNVKKTYLYSYTYFDKFDWLICSEAEEDEYLKSQDIISEQLGNVVIIGIIVMVGIIILCVIIGNAIARPITDSVKILNQIAEGNITESLKSIDKLEKTL